MIAVLHAIERHTAALTTRPRARTEADFLTRYRAHVIDQHGKLEPPDFERRRRVPIADIYVPTVIYEDNYPERTVASPLPADPPALTVWDLAGRRVPARRSLPPHRLRVIRPALPQLGPRRGNQGHLDGTLQPGRASR
jgi:hypothetical protein